ncbi:hypothetical protein [Pontibacter fetidus]|uniref:Uncharacterized protein n=1 Tax=Pontibacter fetidus TaxID=2700082 RepID=A0A6B2H4P1_9BACT|nr:hypothetical protein [Pontibacter fetidus]NDK57431.1 hypothetical protein [Pontibacter fetidus]
MEFFLRQIYPWLIEVSSASALLPFVVGLFLLRKTKGVLFWLIFTHISLAIISESVSHLTVYLGAKNNIWVIHIYTLLEFLILSSIFYYSFRRPLFRKGIILAVVLFTGICLIDAFVLEGITQMNSLTKVSGNAMLILMGILYFYKIANDLTVTYLDQDPVFLLSCGILIHKAGTTMSYAMFNAALAASYDAARICIAIMLVLNFLYYAFLALILKRATT